MSMGNKILLVLIIILLLVLVGLVLWQKILPGGSPSYSAVYLRTGDLYFGELVQFPWFGLKNVYTIQVNQQDSQNPISIQKFANVFWGPEDFLKINREQVVWITKLNQSGQLAQLLKNNPQLSVPQEQTNQLPGTAPNPALPASNP